MQTFIFIVIVTIAAIYIVRRMYQSFINKPKAGCDCGCSGCSQSNKTTCGH